MIPYLALLGCAVLIWTLFRLDDNRARTSLALWLPTIWILIAASRAPSAWFQTQGQIFVGAGQQYLDGNPFERDIFSGLLALATVVLFMRGPKVTKLLKENIPIVVFILYCALSLLWSDYPEVGFKRWTKLAGDLGMVLIVLTENDPAAAFDRLMARVGFILVPLSVVLSRYFPSLGRAYDITGNRMFWTGVTTNKNTLGILCMIVGLVFLWRVLQEWRRGRRRGTLVSNGIIFLASAYILQQCDSATSKSCLILGAGIITAIHLLPLARKPAMVHLMALGAIGISVTAVFFTSSLLENVGRNSTLTGRTELWSIVLSQPVDRVIGTGYEGFWLGDRLTTIWRLSGQNPVQAHDGYIEILINLGWVGIVVLGYAILAGYWKIMRAMRWEPERESLPLAFFTAALIYNLTEAAFKMSDPVWIFFVWGVMSVSPTRKSAAQMTSIVRVAQQREWYAETAESFVN